MDRSRQEHQESRTNDRGLACNTGKGEEIGTGTVNRKGIYRIVTRSGPTPAQGGANFVTVVSALGGKAGRTVLLD